MAAQGELQIVLTRLVESGAQFLVVGGVAVVLHGHPRFTADLDLVINLDPQNLQKALAALDELQYSPRAPVSLRQFADAQQRESWVQDKGLTVFSLWSPDFAATELDLFVQEPFVFSAAWQRALHADLGFAKIPVASIDDLIDMKKQAGRDKDLLDIQALKKLRKDAIHG